MYRINYGNGQVSNTIKSLAAAKRELAAQREYDRRHNQGGDYSRIEKQVEVDMWTTVKEKR